MHRNTTVMIYSFLNQKGGVGKTTLSIHTATELARSIILASDIVVIPLQPSPMDVWAAADTVDLTREAQMLKPDLKMCLVLNRKITNTAIGRDVRSALEELEVPVQKTDIGQRVAFAETAAVGKTVLNSQRSKAAKEIKKLVKELRKLA